MILITRVPEPAILADKKDIWLQSYLQKRAKNPGQRPSSSQYGHQEIREILESMSFHKCFYCERKLTDIKGEIDHHITVEDDPKLAFTWTNLYLSCPDCNRKKLSNKTIPIADCLDPCNSSVDPANHLTFDDEIISSKGDSAKGLKTIQKYKLDRPDLNYLRAKQLQRFHKILIKLQDRQIQEGRTSLTSKEKEALNSFKQADHAFSLMFQVFLAELTL